jgi:ATP-binding cassette subfamily B (MDR/TAP) protein 1
MFPLLIFGGWMITRNIQEGDKRSRRAFEQAGGIAEEILYKIKTIASFANFLYEKDRFDERLETSYKVGKTNAWKTALGMGFIFASIFGSYSLAIWYGSKMIAETVPGQDGLKVGDILTCMFSIIFGTLALGQASGAMKVTVQGCVAASDFFELRDRVPKIDLTNSIKKPSKEEFKGKIEFRNVNFSYNLYEDLDLILNANPEDAKLKNEMKSKTIFESLNLTFNPGEKTALVGQSGCGKSTIGYLIQRLYDIVSGEIMIDDYNIKELDLEYFRSIIGYVPQEPVLFNNSIRENIIFGRENITDEQIKEACIKANATEFINQYGLDYVVGVRGGKLSGGQKQRIAIARAILLKPKILILDEATSALDNDSEKKVQVALDKVSQGISTIIIAHRLSTIMNSDKIVLIHEGEVAETGTHSELMKKEGKYYSLVKNQLMNDDQNDEDDNISERSRHSTVNKIVDKEDLADNVISNEKELAEKFNKLKKEILPIILERKGIVLAGTFFACLAGAIWPIYGLFLATTIKELSSPDMESVKKEGIIMAIHFLGLALVSGISVYFQNYFFTVQGEHLTKRLRSMVFEKYLRLHIGYFDNTDNTPGALLTRLSSDTTKLNGIALSMVSLSVQSISTLILGITLGMINNWKLSLINIGFLPLIIITSIVQLRLRQRFTQTDQHVESQAGSILSECVCNTKTVFSYNMQNKVVDMYESILETKNKTIAKSSFIYGILFGTNQLLIYINYAVMFYAGGKLAQNSTEAFDVGNMLKAMFCIIMSGAAISMAQQYVGDIETSKKALFNVFDTLNEPSLIDPLEENPSAIKKEIEGRIEFKNVCFSYPTKTDQIIFSDLSFIIEPGQSAAFVGYSGSGKSTVVQLIERFYDVTSGAILIDGINIKSYDLATLRKKISLVMQEPVLFNEDIIKNVNYGDLTKGLEDVEIAMKNANISDLLSSDYDKKVIPVSGGQKQRLAIARAMIRNPRILLLDEATSALDKKSEEIVQETLNEAMKGRTSIVIAHR